MLSVCRNRDVSGYSPQSFALRGYRKVYALPHFPTNMFNPTDSNFLRFVLHTGVCIKCSCNEAYVCLAFIFIRLADPGLDKCSVNLCETKRKDAK
jgi:hypothetical protein